MDFLSIVGVMVAFAAILGGNFLEGGHFDALVNGPAMVIVLGGTMGAMLLQTPPAVFLHGIRMLRWIIVPPEIALQAQIKKLVGWSALARKEGLLGLESILAREKDLFAKKGLLLLVDGNEPEIIRDCMEVELAVKEHRDVNGAQIFEAMGGYAPTIGIIGAVMGLIHVMQNLADPSQLGSGLATAFVATIYGVGLANLLFLPIANKLRSQCHAVVQSKELVIEGIIAISEGENPRNIEIKLSGFL